MKLPVLPAIVAIALLGGLAFVERAEAQLEAQFGDAPERLECESLDCASILPGATRFEREEGRSFVTGRDEAGELVGWVFLSTEIVDIPAYSGKPLVTLIGLNPEGTITGIRIVHHSEPILLVGIPFSELETFGAFYVGKPIETRIVVGNASDEESLAVDAISGATVTALAQNRTILESARLVGSAVGVFDLAAARPGHFVESEEIWPWARLVSEGVFGRLTVSEAQMGTGESRAPFIDLHFTIADAPQVGRSLLGERTYAAIHEQLQPGEHIFVVLGNGSNSFKGSAFVRGGIFDRIRVEQNLTELMFRDTDYENLGQPRAAGAPRFKEGAVFISRGAVIDPGSPYQMVFLGSR
ncbi:MAG: FMN-binding protein, partial [Myxococcales bacterium]|nr:FMN-binding protein [Myxococcales bacterium]